MYRAPLLSSIIRVRPGPRGKSRTQPEQVPLSTLCRLRAVVLLHIAILRHYKSLHAEPSTHTERTPKHSQRAQRFGLQPRTLKLFTVTTQSPVHLSLSWLRLHVASAPYRFCGDNPVPSVIGEVCETPQSEVRAQHTNLYHTQGGQLHTPFYHSRLS